MTDDERAESMVRALQCPAPFPDDLIRQRYQHGAPLRLVVKAEAVTAWVFDSVENKHLRVLLWSHEIVQNPHPSIVERLKGELAVYEVINLGGRVIDQ